MEGIRAGGGKGMATTYLQWPIPYEEVDLTERDRKPAL